MNKKANQSLTEVKQPNKSKEKTYKRMRKTQPNLI
jgi:hypothetical protein